MTSSLYGLALHLSFVAMRGAANAGGRTLEREPEMSLGKNGIETRGESAERAAQALEKG